MTRGRLRSEDTFLNGKQAMVDYNYDDLGRVSTTYCGVEYESMEIRQQSYSLQGWALHNGATYSYDSNGNMTHDGRRGLNVEYNLLNLPSEAQKSDR